MKTEEVSAAARRSQSVRVHLAGFVWTLLVAIDAVFFAAADHPLSVRAFASLAAQQAIVVWVYTALDSALPWRWARALLLATLFAYLSWHLLDLVCLYLLTTHAVGVLRILSVGSHAIEVLSQTGVAGLHVATVLATTLGALIAFALLRRVLPALPRPPRWHAWAAAVAALLALGWSAEQTLARRESAYVDRASHLPTYWRLFDTGLPSHESRIPPLPADAWLDSRLPAISAPERPLNVLFVLLESVRYDVISPEFAPRTHALGESAIWFSNARTEGIFTPLAWNALLLNRPAYMLRPDVAGSRKLDAGQLPGAFPLRVLEAAGYTNYFAMPSDLEWMDFKDRILGGRGVIDHYFSSFPGHNDARGIADDRATDQVVHWIAEDPADPFFMMIELDSTHWTYFFDERAAVARPYSKAMRPRDAVSQRGLDRVHNRYRNAMRHVDGNIGRMLDALAQAGVADRTAVVIVSDHGEGFEIGNTGHTYLAPETLRVPWILSIPSAPPRRIDAIVPTRSVFPTLFEALGIRGIDRRALLGRPVDLEGDASGSALTFHGSMGAAELTLPGCSVRFEVTQKPTEIEFTPVAMRDARGRPIRGWVSRLEELPWREALDRGVTGIFGEIP